MSDLIEDTNPRDLRELLGQINTKETALPDFQRDFVWDPKMTKELIVSIASSYPAGSILRIRHNGAMFVPREFQGAPDLGGASPTYLVLDGQQRLTSLYQAFYGVGEHLYFVNLRKLLEGTDFDDAIFHLRADSKRAKGLLQVETQDRELTIALSLLKKGTGEFYRWAGHVARKEASKSAQDKMEEQLKEIADKWIEPIWDYRFPVVTLSSRTSVEAVCTIFETLNRTGVKLSPFELLAARYRPGNLDLRHLWQTSQDSYPILEEFAIDPYYILQSIALLSRASPSVKRGDVLKLEPAAIQTWWDQSVKAFSRALEILRDDCGVLLPRWLPYDTIVIPMAAVLAHSGVIGSSGEVVARQKLTRWFWCSVFGQTYENTPTGQSVTDYKALGHWLNGGAIPDSVTSFTFDEASLMNATARQRAVYNGAMCIILRNSPRDFHSGSKLTPDLVETAKIDDHHIFPQAYLRGKGVAQREIDSVLNKTLIDRRTNIRIGAKAPSIYMADIRAGMPAGDFDGLLGSHLLPTAPDSPLFKDDFHGFLEWRKHAVAEQVRVATA